MDGLQRIKRVKNQNTKYLLAPFRNNPLGSVNVGVFLRRLSIEKFKKLSR